MARLPGAINWLKGDRETMPVLLTGGTVSEYQEMALKEAYGLDEVIRETSDLPHINFRLNVTGSYRSEDYTDAAVDFVDRAERAGRKALVYGYSTTMSRRSPRQSTPVDYTGAALNRTSSTRPATACSSSTRARASAGACWMTRSWGRSPSNSTAAGWTSTWRLRRPAVWAST